MAINKNINTSKTGVKPYLDKAAEATKKSFHAGVSMKMAFIRLAADISGLKGTERAELCKLLAETPGWFGCGNNSACRQAYEAKSAADEVQKDYGAW